MLRTFQTVSRRSVLGNPYKHTVLLRSGGMREELTLAESQPGSSSLAKSCSYFCVMPRFLETVSWYCLT